MPVRWLAALALAVPLFCACGSRADPMPVRSAHDLGVAITSPACVATNPPDREELVERAVPTASARPYWSFSGCAPVRLSRGPSCDWACVAEKSAPCGNGSTYRMVVFVVDGRIASTFAVTDFDLFRRDFHVESTRDGPRLRVVLRPAG